MIDFEHFETHLREDQELLDYIKSFGFDKDLPSHESATYEMGMTVSAILLYIVYRTVKMYFDEEEDRLVLQRIVNRTELADRIAKEMNLPPEKTAEIISRFSEDLTKRNDDDTIIQKLYNSLKM